MLGRQMKRRRERGLDGTWLMLAAVLLALGLFLLLRSLLGGGGDVAAPGTAGPTETARALAAAGTATAQANAAAPTDAASPTEARARSSPTPLGATPAGTRVPLATASPGTGGAPDAPEAPPTLDPVRWAGTSLDGGAIGGTFTLADRRLGAHEDRERVVWEMAEATGGPPSYRVTARLDAEGPYLEVVLRDVYAWERPELLETVQGAGGPIVLVRQAQIGDDAALAWEVRLARAAPFEAVWLQEPARLVVDVLTGAVP